MDTEGNLNTPEVKSESEVAEKVEIEPTTKKSSFFSKNKKLLIIFCTVLIGIGVFAAFFLSSKVKKQKLNDARTKAYQAIRKGDYVTAQKAAKEGFAVDPKDPYLVKNYIDAVTSQGNATGKEAEALKTVEPYIQDLLKGNENNVDTLLSVGYAYEAAGQYEKALTYYEKAISINPKSSEAYFHKGHVFEFLDRTNEAFAEYDKAYEADNNNALTLMGKGREVAARGDVNSAFNFFKKSSEVKGVPLQIRSEALTSASLIKQSQTIYMKEAIDLAHQAVIASPHFSPALGTYGYLLSINGNPRDGMFYLNLGIKENPRISKNYWQGGVVLRVAKKYSDAVKYLNVAIEKVKNDNTLIGSQTKKRVLGLIYYDLARTYYENDNTSPYVIQSLKYAVFSDATLKEIINNDENKYKIFKNLESNSEFITLRQ